MSARVVTLLTTSEDRFAKAASVGAKIVNVPFESWERSCWPTVV